MHKFLLLAAVLAFPMGIAFADQVDDVISLERQGVTNDVLFAYIDKLPNNQRLTTNDVVRLIKGGVSDDAIVVLVRHTHSQSAVPHAVYNSSYTGPSTVYASPPSTVVYNSTPSTTYVYDSYPYYNGSYYGSSYYSYGYPYYGYGYGDRYPYYGSGLSLNFDFGGHHHDYDGHYGYGRYYGNGYGNGYYSNRYSGNGYYGNRYGLGTGYTSGNFRNYSRSGATRSPASRSSSGYRSGSNAGAQRHR